MGRKRSGDGGRYVGLEKGDFASLTVHNSTPTGKVEMLGRGRVEQSKICLGFIEGITSESIT